MREAVAGIDSVRHVICSGEVDGDVLALAALEQADPAPIVQRADSDLAALLYTGGTTGRAKGVMLSHDNLHFSGHAGYEAGYVPGVNRSLGTLPLSHAYGLLVTIVGMHSVEQGVSALLRWFDPDAFLSLIEEHRLQVSAVVPSMLQILLSQPLEERDLSSLQYLSCGAAPLAREVEERDLPPDPVGHDPPGIRADRDRGADRDQPGGTAEVGVGRNSGAGHDRAHRRRRTDASSRPAKSARSARARRA